MDQEEALLDDNASIAAVRIGFLINPLSGMGGVLGLGGTDGMDFDELLSRGAREVAPVRAAAAIRSIRVQPCFPDLDFQVCSDKMGQESLLALGIGEARVVYQSRARSTASDTQEACEAFRSEGAEMILFVGGDGTARDVYSVVGKAVPILGVPSGVKMHSSVFLATPTDAGSVIQSFFDRKETVEREVMDVDEEEFRAGRVSARLFGLALVPSAPQALQPAKSPTDHLEESAETEELAEYFAEMLETDTLYIMGTGGTVRAIVNRLGIEKNELAVSAVLNGREVSANLDEKGLLGLLDRYPRAKLIVTPIGGQGFIFGRGNQQISPAVISQVGKENVVIVSTPSKLRRLAELRVDTGSPELDSVLKGHWKVLTGYGKYKVKPLR